MLLSVAEAERLVLETVPRSLAEDCPLAAAFGRVLRDPILADRDLPPCDRATLDGIAIRHAAWVAGRREFRREGALGAGSRAPELTDPDACWEIMTGATLPSGCDTVIPCEEFTWTEANARVDAGAEPVCGQGVHRQASDAVAGTPLVPAGVKLAAAEIGVAAAVGRATLRVAAVPRIAVVATGDELVEVDAQPAPYQIRRSNDYALRAALQAGGVGTVDRFLLRDHEPGIESTLRQLIVEYDWLVVCGGVSKGRFDFLPAVLARLKVTPRFRGVAQRPGKPFGYGTTPRSTPLFMLPGNPVSALICLRRYVFPALGTALGMAAPPTRFAALGADTGRHSLLTRFIPARLESSPDDARSWAALSPPNTSGDFARLAGSAGFVELPSGDVAAQKGTTVRFWPWV